MENKLYGTPNQIKQQFGGWRNFVSEKPRDSYDIYFQFSLFDLGQAFVEYYAGSKNGKYADMAREIAKSLARRKTIKRTERDFFGIITPYERDSDCRSLAEMINEGDEDSLSFGSFGFGTGIVPFGNTQRNYPNSLEDGDPTPKLIEEAFYDMKRKGDFKDSK